jgi:hypothetical protein
LRQRASESRQALRFPTPGELVTTDKTAPEKTDAEPQCELTHQLPTVVYEEEVQEIAARRRVVGLEAPPVGANESPSAKHGLVGLALSGGGIRSATFSLGVIQALARKSLPDGKSVFEKIDYLSTVSGGGYTGSMLSSLLSKPGAHEPFPLQKTIGEQEPPALQHLRNGSNYLSPGGVLDQLRLPLQVIRGLLLNTILVMPWIMLAVCCTRELYGRGWGGHLTAVLTMGGALLAGVMVLLFALLYRRLHDSLGWTGRNRIELAASALFGLALLGGLSIPIKLVVTKAIETPWSDDSLSTALQELTGFWFKWIPLGWAGVAVGVAGMVLLARYWRPWGEVMRKTGWFALGLVGPIVLFAAYVLLCMVEIETPYIHGRFEKELPTELNKTVPVRDELRAEIGRRGIPSDPSSCVLKCADKASGPARWLLPKSCDPLNGTQLAESCSTCEEKALNGTLQGILDACGGAILERQGQGLLVYGFNTWSWYHDRDLQFLLIAVLVVLVSFLLIDVNSTSLHGFYRDRLSKLYLFRLVDKKVHSSDALKLSELNTQGVAEGSAAPYHLLNVTLNLPGSSGQEMRGRKSDFFFFSKHWCGGPHAGFCKTPLLEQADPRINLGTAMAISGAAAAPNMGAMGLGQLRFLMAMLNVRLSYWVPNPRLVNKSTAPWRWMQGPGPRYLLKEALGSVDASGLYLNVSDGGHLENLGVYELLRRRCKVIIAIDGEADSKMRFPSLHALMRYAWIDLGVRIELSLEELLPKTEGRAAQHVAIGTIHYGEGKNGQEGSTGTFVYIKSSVTGDETQIIADYRAANPAFPHESTADQFFTEHQFEAYRSLGEHIGKRLVQMKEFTPLFSTRPVQTLEEGEGREPQVRPAARSAVGS